MSERSSIELFLLLSVAAVYNAAMIYTNMTAPSIILASAAITASVVLWVHITKRRFNKQSLIFAAVLTLLLTAASFLVHDKDMSGTGWRTQSGWPHAVFMSWESFESEYPTSQDSIKSFSVVYLVINLTIIVPIASFVALLPSSNRRIKKNNI